MWFWRWRNIPKLLLSAILGIGLLAFLWVPWVFRHSAAKPLITGDIAWFVRDYKLVPTREEARRMMASSSFDAQKLVVLDEQATEEWQPAVERLKAHPPATEASHFGFFSHKGSVELHATETAPGHWRITLPDEEGWIVVPRPYEEGWSAKTEKITRMGRSTSDLAILPADGGIIALPVFDQGTGTILLDYRPAVWRRGMIVSAASGAVCLLWLGLRIMRERVPESEPEVYFPPPGQ